MKLSIADLKNQATFILQNKTSIEKPVKTRMKNNSKRPKKRK